MTGDLTKTIDPVSDERLGTKYRVERTSDPPSKHEECRYFVLDPQHDPHAVTALRAYSAAARAECPGLADDLDAWVGAERDEEALAVVDEAEIQDIVRDAYDTHIDLGSPARRGEFVFTATQVIAARLRGTTRG